MDIATRRVLIIDDNEDDYLIVRDLLSDITAERFVVDWVETVEAAREALDTQKYDVSLVDHRLSGRNGLALIQERILGDPPFILLTGNEDHAVDIAATQAGAMDYLVKGQINTPLLERSIRYAIERSKRETALEAALYQERLLSTAVHNLANGMIVTDAVPGQNFIVFSNPAFSVMTGYSKEEVLGRNCAFLQGEDTDPQAVQKIRDALREQRPYHGTILNYRKDGTPFWNDLSITPVFNAEGQLTSFVGLQSDITAQRQAKIALSESEARKTAILEAALDAIITIDHTQRVVEFNPAAEKIFGYSRTQALGRDIDHLMIVARSVRGSKLTRVSQLCNNDFLPNQRIELIGRRADGTEFPAELALTCIGVQGTSLFTAHVRDISERKKAEESLRQSEANLRAAQQVARLGSWELNLSFDNIDRNTLQWSDEVFRIFGYQPGEIEVSNQRFFEGVHPDDKERVQSAIARTIETGQPYSLDHRILLPAGSERVVHEQAEVIFDSQTGKALKILGTVQDITERKRQEEQTAASEARYRRLFESAKDGILILDAYTGCIMDANPFLVQLLGYEIEDLRGKNLWEIGLFGDVAANAEALTALQKTDGARDENLILETKSGESIAVEFVSNVYEVDGSKIIQCNLRDITTRQQAEAQLHFQKTLLEAQTEASLDGILVISDEGKILSYNQRFLQMWQISPQAIDTDDAPLLRAVFSQVADPRQFLERVKYLSKNRQEHSHEEIHLRDGRIFDRYSAPITSAQGDYFGRVWYFRDVTASKQAHAALARLAAVVESSSDAIISQTLDGVITSWNHGAELLYGYSSQDAIGQSALHLLARNNVDEELQSLDKIAQGEWVADYETVRTRKDGHLIDVSVTFSAIKNEAGEVVGASAISRDISDRIQAINALRASDERFQSIVASVPGMVYQFVLHPDGTVDWPFVSEGCRELCEVGPEVVQKDPQAVLRRVHEDDKDRFESSIAASAATLSPWIWVGRQRMNSGKITWVQGASRPQRLPDGSTLWNGLVMDITARKEAEEERDYFFTMSIDMLGIAGQDGYFKRVNPAFKEILGFSEAEILSRPFLERVHPEDQASTKQAMETLSQGRNVVAFENRFVTKSGSYRWLEWKSVVIPDEGLIYTAARDVTDRKEANAILLRANDVLEERVAARTLELEQTNAALQIQIVEREEAEAETRARARQQEVVAELGRRALSNIDLNTLLQGALALSAAVLDVDYGLLLEWLPESQEAQIQATVGQPHYPLQTRMPVPPGSFAHYVLRSSGPVIMNDRLTESRFEISPMMREQNIRSLVSVAIQVGDQLSDTPAYGVFSLGSQQPGAFGEEDENFVQSVSNILATAIEQRRIQQVALLARQEAERANHAKSEFLSRMSHELRTPLNAILGFGQILERQELSPLQREGVGYILKGGHHLLALINEVLDIARVEAGQMELSVESVNLVELVAECCALVRPLADQRSIQLHDLVPSETPHHVLADHQRLKQVVINLVSNAIKYNKTGGEVAISVRQTPDNKIQLQVKDSGPGMTSQDMQKLFTPFERLNAADLQIEGTGLGLVLSKRLVTGMGGVLGVESAVGQGSTFWVELPLADSPLQTLAESSSSQPAEASYRYGRTYTVLSIEDNLSNTRVLEAILESRPEISLMTAMHGRLGLELAKQRHPDLILLDLHLPGLTGNEVLTQLRLSAATRDIPVIVISADATSNQIERLMTAGATAYLTKPLNVEAFLGTLDEVLHRIDSHTGTRKKGDG